MKVLLILYGSLKRLTGGTIYDRRMVESLRAQGHRVEVWGLKRLPYWLAPLHSARPRLWRCLAGGRSRPDCLLIDGLVHPALAPAVALRRRLPGGGGRPPGRRPLVGTIVHLLRTAELAALGPGRAPSRAAARLLEGALLRGSDFVVATSRATARLVGERLGERSGRRIPVYVCPPGSPRPAPRRLQRPAGLEGGGGSPGYPVRILSVANLAPIKGQDLLVEALAGLRRLSWRLSLVGGRGAAPRFRRAVEARARRHRLQDRLSWRGPLRGARLRQAYAEADLFALPSRLEMYGMALAEALACGLPCVAFDTGGVAEVLTGGGILVPPGDLAGFRRALERLLTDPALRARLAGQAREAARRLPTWEEAGRRFGRALLDSARRAAGPGGSTAGPSAGARVAY